jgi:cell division protein FtsW
VLRAGHIIFLCALALLCLGVVMVNSATMHVFPIGSAEASKPSAATSVAAVLHEIVYSKSTVYMGLAIGVMTLAALFTPVAWLDRLARLTAAKAQPHAPSPLWDERVLQHLGWSRDADAPSPVPNARDASRKAWIILALGTALLVTLQVLPFVPGLGRPVNGSHRWLYIPLPGLGELSVQPSEIAKWGLVALLAWYGAVHAHAMASFKRGLFPALLALGLVAGAVVKEDLGTGLLIACAGCLILIAAGARVWQFLTFVPVAALGLVVAVLSNPYRLERLQTFIDPFVDPQGRGYHMIQSMLAVSGGEGAGRGLGHGLLKFGYLPEDHNDFLFAIICEELGVAGALLICSLFAGLLWAGLAVVRKHPSPVLKLVSLGVIATVGLQALINQFVVTGLGPTKGIALPLVSSGGTGWILTAASLGVVIAIDRHAHRIALARNQDDPRELPMAIRAVPTPPGLVLPPLAHAVAAT